MNRTAKIVLASVAGVPLAGVAAVLAIGTFVADPAPTTAAPRSTATTPAGPDSGVTMCGTFRAQLADKPYALPGVGLMAREARYRVVDDAFRGSRDPKLAAAGHHYADVDWSASWPSTSDRYTFDQQVDAFHQLAAQCGRRGVTLAWTPETAHS